MRKKLNTLFGLFVFLSCGLFGQSVEDVLSDQIDIIVDHTGNGDYTTINSAISAVPDNSSSQTVIFIRIGVYFEKVEIPGSKINLTIIGEDIDETIIDYDDYSGSGEPYEGILNYTEIGTSTSHTLYAKPENFTIINLTIKNSAGRVGQAVALNLHGDKQSVINCRLLGNQDTFYTWGYGRFYIANSYIEGNVDFIFGRGVAYFENCLIVSNRSGSDVTAASTDENWKYGYVFNNCKLEGLPDVESVTMGRPWKPFCQVVFMNSELGNHIDEEGWSRWNDTDNHLTTYYGVYENFGPGSSTENYPDWTHVLTSEEASNYTRSNVFSKDVSPEAFSSDWSATSTIHESISSQLPNVFEDTLYYLPILDKIVYQGKEITEYDPKYSLYSTTIHSEEIEEDALEVITLDPKATASVQLPDKVPGNAIITVTTRNGTSSNFLLKFWFEPLSVKNEFVEAVFPNPVEHTLNFSLQSKPGQNWSIRIFDLSGAEMRFKKINSHERDVVSLDVSLLKGGLYTYELKAGNKLLTGRFLKQ